MDWLTLVRRVRFHQSLCKIQVPQSCHICWYFFFIYENCMEEKETTAQDSKLHKKQILWFCNPLMCSYSYWKKVYGDDKWQLGLVPNSRWGQLDKTGMIDAKGTTEFYFDHDANKFKIHITSIKIDVGEWRRVLIYLTNYPFEKYRLLFDSGPLNNPLHTVALHLTTIVTHLVKNNSHFGNNVSMSRRAYVSYAIFLVTHWLNSNILENYDGRNETPWPMLFSSNHFIQRDGARRELGTAPYWIWPLSPIQKSIRK